MSFGLYDIRAVWHYGCMALGLYGIRAVYGTTLRRAMEKGHATVLVELQRGWPLKLLRAGK